MRKFSHSTGEKASETSEALLSLPHESTGAVHQGCNARLGSRSISRRESRLQGYSEAGM